MLPDNITRDIESKLLEQVNAQRAASMPSFDPNAYSGFDTSPLKKAYGAAIKTNAARGRNNLAAQFGKLGVEGADRNNAMAQASADENLGLAQMEGEMSMKEYQSKIDAMNRAMQQWSMVQQMNNQTQGLFDQSRNQSNPFMNLLGTAGGVALAKYGL